MTDLLNWLGPRDFTTRDMCGAWGQHLPIINQFANSMIALAYFLIPSALLSVARDKGLIKSWPARMFGLFIVLCGIGHICDVLAFHWPAYRVFTFVDVCTAAVSCAVAAASPAVVRMMMR